MCRLKLRKNAFTLAETMIVCTIFAIMVVGIILGINRAFLFMNNTRVLVRATNFAREGVEMVYNLRDTNRRRYSGKKDEHWMDTGTGSTKLEPGIYVIKEGIMGTDNDIRIYADKLDISSSDIENFYDLDGFFNANANQGYRDSSKIVFTGEYSYYSGSVDAIATGKLEDLLGGSGTEFYRVLRVYGVYEKNVSDDSDLVTDYDSSDPKELRFCVKVFYEFNGAHHASELCSIMTNFME